MRRFAILGLVTTLTLTTPCVWAQEGPVRGVVWTPPTSIRQAERELRDMRTRGIEAIRTGPVRRERLLMLADTLGLAFYQDLPIAYLSAPALADTLDHARQQLVEILDVARRHSSARHFGLARLSETSDSSACTYFRRLASLVRGQGPAGSRVYYVTAFMESDRCADAVDAVLVDARNADVPYRRIAAWQSAHLEATGGVGALGTWVRQDGLRGLRVPHSLEAQARYFERHLGHLLADTVSAVPPVVFVYRWRDARDGPSDPYGRPYGLHAADGTPRPAAKVVTGFFTGEQTIFAFPAGAAPRGAAPWLVLLGWSLVATLAVIYFREPRVRHTLVRYFWAHRFYQEAVAEGREVLVGSSLALLGGSILGIGALGAVFGRCFQEAPSMLWALNALPAGLQSSLAALMDQPGALGVVLAALYVVSLVFWISLLVLVGQFRMTVSIEQVTMVVGWPQWPMLLVLLAAMVTSSFAPETGRSLVPVLLGATGGLALWMTGRTLADFAAIAKVPRGLAVLPALVSPLSFLLGVAFFLVAKHDVPLGFIWHLLTRT